MSYLVEEPLDISFYHFVCDANVRENGSSTKKTIEWIKSIVNEDDKITAEVVDMQSHAANLQKLINEIKLRRFNSEGYFKDKLNGNYTEAKLLKTGSNKITIPFGRSILEFRMNIIKYLAKKFENTNSERNLIGQKETIFYEGGTLHHAIAFYLLENNEVIICNSGDGLQNEDFHEKKEDGKFEVITKFQLLKNARWIFLATIIVCSEWDHSILKADLLYDLLRNLKIMQKIPTKNDFTYFFPPQISGSCSFWSTFYALMYKSRWTKPQLENTLLKAAAKYFVMLAPTLRKLYGYNGLLSCVATTFEKHEITEFAMFAENEYKDLFENQRLHTKFGDFSSHKEQFSMNDENETQEEKEEVKTLTDLSGFNISEYLNLNPVSAIKYYTILKKLIYQEFNEIKTEKEDLRLKMYNWMEVLWKLQQYEFERYCPNFHIHLKQLILVLILVLNENSNIKLWKKSLNVSESWSDAKKYVFACGIKDKYISKHEDLISRYDCFWELITSDMPFEISIRDYPNALNADFIATSSTKMHLILISLIFPCIFLCNAIFFAARRNLNQAETLAKLAHRIAKLLLEDDKKYIIFTNDGDGLHYKSISLDQGLVSFQTNEFFDLNNLLIDRIVSENFTEEELMQNLPLQRIIFPNQKITLIWPLSGNQFSKSTNNNEFNLSTAKKIPFSTHKNISIRIIAYLCTLFYINDNGSIPKELLTLVDMNNTKKDKFFKDYIHLLNKPIDQITPKDIYEMISNQTYSIGNNRKLEYFCVCVILSLKVPTKIISNDFLFQLQTMYNQAIQIQKIEALYPLLEIGMNTDHKMILDGHPIFYFENKMNEENEDILSSLAFFSDGKMHFYLPEDQKSKKDASSSKFLHLSLLNSTKFTITFETSHYKDQAELRSVYEALRNEKYNTDNEEEEENKQVVIHDAMLSVPWPLHEQILIYNSKTYTRMLAKENFWENKKNTLMFRNEAHEIVIFPSEHFAIEKEANEQRYLLTPHKKLKIVYQNETNASHQRFLTFPHSLILYDDDQKLHLLFLCYAKVEFEYESPWVEYDKNNLRKNYKQLQDKLVNFQLENQTHVIIPIASNSSHLIFQDAQQAFCYMVSCIIYQEVDGLYLHFKQLVYLMRSTCDSNVSSAFDEVLKLFEGSFNNPYSYYFQYIWNSANISPHGLWQNENDYFDEDAKVQWPPINMDDLDFKKAQKPDGHIEFKAEKNYAYEIRKLKYPAVFQLGTNFKQEKLTEPFNKDQKKLMDQYATLLEANVFNMLNRPIETKHLKDDAISAWSKTLDGKEVCQLHDSNKKTFHELKSKINEIRKKTNKLEYDLTLKIITDLKRIPISLILHENAILLSSAMVTRLLLNTLELLDELDTCQMISKYTNYLKSQFIYDGQRSFSYLYLEYMFGFFIRKDQHQFLIAFEQNNHNYIMLQELLMGLGKTSVIMPLLASQEISYREQKTFIVVPKHMHKESYLNLARYSEDIILPLVESSREHAYKNIHQILDPYIHKWLMDDNEFKRMALNKLVWKNNLTYFDNMQLAQILVNTTVIIDEFDSLYNPSTSVLQYPIGELEIEATGLTRKQWIDILRFIFNPTRPIMKQIENVRPDTFAKGLNIANDLKLNQHYGFSHDDLARLTVVPYAYVNKPIEASSFSNILLQFLLTFKIYTNLKSLQSFHYDAINQYIKKYIIDKNIKSKPVVSLILKKIALQDMITVEDIVLLKSMNTKNQLELLQSILSKKLNFKRQFQHFNFKFVKNIVLPSMGDTYWVASISFLEAVYRDPFAKIYAFSGTTNLILPDDKYFSENKQQENIQNKGSIHYAIVYHSITVKWNSSLTNLQNLIELVTNQKMNCFMDAGAFLLGDDIEVLLLKLSSIVSKNILFFSSKNGDKFYITNGTIIPYRFEILPYDSIIVYDQASCIGVNIKQYIPMLGYVSVNEKVSQYEFIAQAIFRLRNINHGHSIRLVTKDKSIDTENILQMLHENSNHFVKFVQEPFRLFQTMTYQSKLPLLRPKFSELRFQDGLVNYVKKIKPFQKLKKDFDAYLAFTTTSDNNNNNNYLQTQQDTTKQKSTEQEQQNENDDLMQIDCNINKALTKTNEKKNSKANEVLAILYKDFKVVFDTNYFELFQFAACFEPWFERDKAGFIPDEVGSLRATNPYYYRIQNGCFIVTNYSPSNQTNNTDEKKTNVFLRWLSGASLNYEQQLELDLLMLEKSNFQRLEDIIHCFNAARKLKFANIKRIKAFMFLQPEEYVQNLQTDHAFAEKLEFYDHKLLKKLLGQNAKKRKDVLLLLPNKIIMNKTSKKK